MIRPAAKRAKKEGIRNAHKISENPIKQPMEQLEVPEKEGGNGDDDEYKLGYEQWLVDGDRFVPVTRTVVQLPAGDYGIRFDRMYDKHVMVMRQPICEDLLNLPMAEFQEVLDDIDTFWASREAYDEYGYVYKRGILLYGPPGCGKSSLISLLGQALIRQQDGIVINICTSDDIFSFDEIMKSIREIEPDRRIIAIIEDIDNFVNANQSGNELMSKLLNMLDGKLQFDNIVMIATTNYPEDLEERITNRPSRFDFRREIGPPKMRAREFYIRTKLKEHDVKRIDIEKWLRDTAGFTIDHLKELVCLVYVHKRKYETALEEVRSMVNGPAIKNTSGADKRKVGFKSRNDDDDDRKKKQ